MERDVCLESNPLLQNGLRVGVAPKYEPATPYTSQCETCAH